MGSFSATLGGRGGEGRKKSFLAAAWGSRLLAVTTPGRIPTGGH